MEILNIIDQIKTRNDKITEIINKSLIKFVKDDIEFTLIDRNVPLGRDHVRIRSHNLKTKKTINFVCYRSNSEVGLWRACVYWAGVKTYYKGSDYITSTFINIELQNFININYEKLPKLDKDFTIYCSTFSKDDTLQEYVKTTKELEVIISTPREVEDQIFKVFKICGAGMCFKTSFVIDNFIKNLKDNEVYEKEFKTILQKDKPINDQNEVDLIYGKPDKYLHVNIKHVYKSMTELMSKYFILLDTKSVYIGSNKVVYNDTTIDLKFYQRTIKNTINSNEYNLFYAKYTFMKTGSPHNGTYYTIINVLPKDAKLIEFGIYDKIVSAGTYIYKILEYKEQCKIDDRGRSVDVDRKSCYVFIGDFMSDLWPLNLIKNES